MKSKTISVSPEKREILEKALAEAGNEKLDLFTSIVGGSVPVACDPAAGVHYSDTTYVSPYVRMA